MSLCGNSELSENILMTDIKVPSINTSKIVICVANNFTLEGGSFCSSYSPIVR